LTGDEFAVYQRRATEILTETLPHMFMDMDDEEGMELRAFAPRTRIPNRTIYDILLSRSDLYEIKSLDSLLRVIINNDVPFDRDQMEVFVLSFLQEMPLDNDQFSLIALLRRLDAEGMPRLYRAVVTHAAFRPSLTALRDPVIGKALLDSYRFRFGENYREIFVSNPYTITNPAVGMQLPEAVASILKPDQTVLSGGRLIGILSKNGPVSPVASAGINDLLAVFHDLEPDSVSGANSRTQDYDLYTTLDIETVREHFARHGFIDLLEKKVSARLMSRRYQAEAYSSWLLRFKDSQNSISVDVIFIDRHLDPATRPPARPQDFIVKEFDIDIAKVWYDGEKIQAKDEYTYRSIQKRQMSLDFHPSMTINNHKSKTTVRRLIKYARREFELVENGNRRMFDDLLDRYARQVLLDRKQSKVYSIQTLSKFLNRFEFEIAAGKDRILAYDRYYVHCRNSEMFTMEKIPVNPQVERPPEHLFLATVIRCNLPACA
jgi:hypothetical protein